MYNRRWHETDSAFVLTPQLMYRSIPQLQGARTGPVEAEQGL